jgi:hypothetical protein
MSGGALVGSGGQEAEQGKAQTANQQNQNGDEQSPERSCAFQILGE